MRSGGRRIGTVAALALGWLAVSGTAAHAQTNDGVTVPSPWLTAGTGNQTVDITVSGSPVVGSAAQISVTTDGGGPVLGVSGAGAGGNCAAQNSGVWFCEPSTVWRAGAITVTVSTAKADSCTGSGASLTCDRTPLTVQITGLGTPADVDGSISISPAQPVAPPTTSAPESRPSTAPSVATVHTTGNTAPTQPSTSAPASEPASKSAVAVPAAVAVAASPSHSPVASASEAPATASAAAAVEASDTSPSSSDGLLLGVLIAAVVVLLAAALAGWRWKARRNGTAAPAGVTEQQAYAVEPAREIESPGE